MIKITDFCKVAVPRDRISVYDGHTGEELYYRISVKEFCEYMEEHNSIAKHEDKYLYITKLHYSDSEGCLEINIV